MTMKMGRPRVESEIVHDHTIQRGEIEWRGATMSYRSDLKPALNNFTLRIEAGAKVGVVGRTGAGKSTLL